MIEECFERNLNYGAGQLSEVRSELIRNDTLTVIAVKNNVASPLAREHTEPRISLAGFCGTTKEKRAFVQTRKSINPPY
jgi:hypothetical protein